MRMRRTGSTKVWVMLLIPLLAYAAFAQTVPPGAGQSYPTVDGNGAWTFYTDSRALYYKGEHEKIYLAFITRQGTPRVWSYDYASGGVDTASLHNQLEQD